MLNIKRYFLLDGIIKGQYYSSTFLSRKNYENFKSLKIKKTLSNTNDFESEAKGKTVYITPDCDIDRKSLKRYLANKGITTTNRFYYADIIIFNNKMLNEISNELSYDNATWYNTEKMPSYPEYCKLVDNQYVNWLNTREEMKNNYHKFNYNFVPDPNGEYVEADCHQYIFKYSGNYSNISEYLQKQEEKGILVPFIDQKLFENLFIEEKQQEDLTEEKFDKILSMIFKDDKKMVKLGINLLKNYKLNSYMIYTLFWKFGEWKERNSMGVPMNQKDKKYITQLFATKGLKYYGHNKLEDILVKFKLLYLTTKDDFLLKAREEALACVIRIYFLNTLLSEEKISIK